MVGRTPTHPVHNTGDKQKQPCSKERASPKIVRFSYSKRAKRGAVLQATTQLNNQHVKPGKNKGWNQKSTQQPKPAQNRAFAKHVPARCLGVPTLCLLMMVVAASRSASTSTVVSEWMTRKLCPAAAAWSAFSTAVSTARRRLALAASFWAAATRDCAGGRDRGHKRKIAIRQTEDDKGEDSVESCQLVPYGQLRGMRKQDSPGSLRLTTW